MTSQAPRAGGRIPDHSRPWDWPYPNDPDDGGPTPLSVEVEPSNREPKPAIYGPRGEVLRWKAPRPIGYRRWKDDPS